MNTTDRAITMARKEFNAIGSNKVAHINKCRSNQPDDYIFGLVGYVMHYYPSADRDQVYSAVESMFIGVESEDW